MNLLSRWFGRRAGPAAEDSRADLRGRGLAHLDAGDWEAARATFEAACARWPDDADLRVNLSTACLMSGQGGEAAAALERALEVAPAHGAAHCNYGMLLAQSGAYDRAATHLRQVPPGHPARHAADINLTNALMHGCDWAGLATHLDGLVAARAQDPQWWCSLEPFQAALLGLPVEVSRAVADAHAHDLLARAGAPLRPAPRQGAGRLRIGYLSSDFGRHATMDLLLEVLEAHDRGRVDVRVYSYGADDGGAERRRAMAACGRFVDLARHSHDAAARAIADDAPDLLVDLKGHTGDGRPQIAARRPAPVIVNYLGYPGSMGRGLADWFVGDATTLPAGAEAQFGESLLRLPRCYQANGALQAFAPPPAREAAGLPADATVLACFNNVYKIGPDTFAAWMDVLHAAPGAVLWLLGGNADATARLVREAGAAGVDPARLVFAPPVPREQHLARLASADLFLDTWPCSAHTLASDAMRAGVPLLTLPGDSFASRVGASVVTACGVPELAAGDRSGHVSMATGLARSPQARADLRARLAAGRRSLFDPAAHARALEDAWLDLHARATRP